MTHSISLASFAQYTATTVIVRAFGHTACKSIELRVDLSTTPVTLRFVVSTEDQEHFFDSLPAAITEYNLY